MAHLYYSMLSHSKLHELVVEPSETFPCEYSIVYPTAIKIIKKTFTQGLFHLLKLEEVEGFCLTKVKLHYASYWNTSAHPSIAATVECCP